MHLVGLAGTRRSGKTVAALEGVKIGEDLMIPIQKMSFADSLREEFSKLKGIGIEMLTNNSYKEEFRKQLIEFGSEKRAIDRYFFPKKLFEKILPHDYVILDDVRYLEELHYILDHGGVVYKIEASNHSREKRGWRYDKDVDEHLSEVELGKNVSVSTFRHLGGDVIYNNDTIEALNEQMMKVIKARFLPVLSKV